MPLHILTLPGSSGKTTWVVNQAREAGLASPGRVRVILPSRLQVADFESRLALAGGSLGVKVGTIGDLAREILEEGGISPLLLSETVQVKVMDSVLAGLDLDYYGAIRDKPGFVRSCLEVLRELKSGGITPGEFSQAAKSSSVGPRLTELGQIYGAYLAVQQEKGWTDRAGQAWLAAESLAARPELCQDWGRLFLDGFDDLTPVQFQLVSHLADRIDDLYLTITGSSDGSRRELVHKRFLRLGELLQTLEGEELKIPAWRGFNPSSPAHQLEEWLFTDSANTGLEEGTDLSLLAVPDREAEVRSAMRWLKVKILSGGIQPHRAAILGRNLEPYRGLISRIAGEYGVPIHLPGGIPLSENPFIAAVLKLVRISAQGQEGLAWYEVLALWRSPYLDWTGLFESSEADHLQDTRHLEATARWGSIVRGYGQWAESFAALIDLPDREGDQPKLDPEPPRGKRAERLWGKFSKFVDLLLPPEGRTSREDYIGWIEMLLGGLDPGEDEGAGLGIVGQILEGPEEIAERDWQALTALNRIFKDMIWAERLLQSPAIHFSQFLLELEEIVGRSSYQPRGRIDNGLVCADCTEVRGLNFQAVALLGLAEGEFPAAIKEDPFLRDHERLILREDFGLPLRLSVDSAEGEYFYETLTRAEGSLLITRPRIAENGALWKESPYWEELLRITSVDPEIRTSRSEIPLNLAANQSEFLEILSSGGDFPPGLKDRIAPEFDRQILKLTRAREVLRQRGPWGGSSPAPANGYLGQRRSRIAERYPEDFVWSASRLESYQTCPFKYFIGNLLNLEELEDPEEGFDARQLGSIYHEILEELYQRVEKGYTVVDLLDALPVVAGPILREAPRKQGFRETAWWEHSQQEILDNLKLGLIRLEEIDPQFRFYAAEQRFGIRPGEEGPLKVEVNGGGGYLLRGFIDRVDLNQRGEIRIIDYKTSGKTGFDNRAVQQGTKLQLPLYALAAQQALNLGQVKEGFYFHLLAAEPSNFKLSSYQESGKKGPELALQRAAENGWQAILSIKEGSFAPLAPDGGCPSYCPAAGFCWSYRPARW